MDTLSREQLEARVQELEVELRERERDLVKYREELSRANSRLEALIGQLHQELKLAYGMLKAIVPTEFPHVAGFEFSTKFVPSMVQGGDYFDIFSHEDRLRFGLVLACGSGHATSALFLSVLLKFTGQMEARKGADPGQIVRLMASELLPNMEPAARADLFYGLVDRRNYELTYCRLGDVVALHQSFPSGEIKLLAGTAPALTAEFKTEITTQTVSLSPRDKLVLCSRGVVETPSLQGETFGLARLSRAVADGAKRGVHEVRTQILYDLQKFAGGQEPPRDLTVVVVEVKDKVIKLAKSESTLES